MIKHHFDHDSVVRVVVITGDFSRSDIVNYQKEIVDRPDSHRIAFVDLSGVTSCSLRFEDTLEHARHVNRIPRDCFNEIILAPTQLGYGLARMYAAGANERFQVEIFEDEGEARSRLTHLLERSAAEESKAH